MHLWYAWGVHSRPRPSWICSAFNSCVESSEGSPEFWALGSLPSLPRMGWSAVRRGRGVLGGGRAQAAGLKL